MQCPTHSPWGCKLLAGLRCVQQGDDLVPGQPIEWCLGLQNGRRWPALLLPGVHSTAAREVLPAQHFCLCCEVCTFGAPSHSFLCMPNGGPWQPLMNLFSADISSLTPRSCAGMESSTRSMLRARRQPGKTTRKICAKPPAHFRSQSRICCRPEKHDCRSSGNPPLSCYASGCHYLVSQVMSKSVKV